ncbi:DUF4192 domain-containing protein [Micromonospora inositola]|uniref:DUF4192 domain-containing protein n=1 Tax=Micromonospora inositola TaxID=47865 RepID=A0A1C5K535_9ACTN|nr:DUF4192 domain-containing protein [Micromonospora inositola]SCG77711.1 protein of unknown function [Micromonospora inositola]
MSDKHRLPVTSPADLIAAVPYLLGFHPTDSLVLVGLAGTRVAVASRTDLPDPADPVGWADELMPQQLRMLRHAGVTTAIVIGYGPTDLVTPVVDTVTPRLRDAGIDVFDALRVTDRRYYSYLCQDLTCCPIDGVPFDPDRSDLTLHAIVAGCSTLPDRRALVASIAPIDGPARTAVTRATYKARARRRTLSAEGGRDALIRAGEDIVRETFARYADDQVLTDDELAWLTVLLPITAIRDTAWRATDSQPWHVALWSDITRRAQPDLAAPPASLLAFAAWRSGAGALASVAVDRALQANPSYSLAQLIDRALREGLPPSVLDGWPDQDFPTAP